MVGGDAQTKTTPESLKASGGVSVRVGVCLQAGLHAPTRVPLRAARRGLPLLSLGRAPASSLLIIVRRRSEDSRPHRDGERNALPP